MSGASGNGLPEVIFHRLQNYTKPRIGINLSHLITNSHALERLLFKKFTCIQLIQSQIYH